MEVVPFVSTGATLPVGQGLVLDGVTIGASTGVVELVKLMDGTAGSSVTIPASLSSLALDAVGLNVSITNSTANPIGVELTGGQSSVSVVGNVNVTFSTASTGSVLVSNTTATAVPAQLVLNSTLVSTAQPLPVLLQDSTATLTVTGTSTATIANTTANAVPVRLVVNSTLVSTAQPLSVQIISNSSAVSSNTPLPVDLRTSTATVTIQGNTTATVVLTTASKMQVELSTTLMGGSTGNPLFTFDIPFLAGTSTFASTTITSTTAWTAFSSAGSTRFVITDIEVTNQGGTLVLLSVFDGTTGGTVIDRTYCATAGGGKVHAYVTPVYNTTGNAITVQQDAASTITVNLRGYRSS